MRVTLVATETELYTCIAVGVAVTAKNKNVFIVAMVTQQWDLFALLSRYSELLLKITRIIHYQRVSVFLP